jgi:membrane protease YdiL (CAAX protease family)
MRQLFRSRYGASPVHLLGLLASFLVAFLAARHVHQADPRSWWRYALWFAGAAVAHDLVLFPVYSALDRALQRLRPRRMSPDSVNFVRVPAVLSGLLLLVFLPAISKGGEASFQYAAGRSQDGIFLHWVVVTVVLFGLSGLLYVARRLRA